MATSSQRILGRQFVLTCAASLLATLALSLYFPTLPLRVVELAGGAGPVGLVVGMIGIGSMFFRPVVGWLVDGVGRRSTLVVCFAVLGAASVLIAVAPSLPILAFGVFVLGAAFALGSTAATTLANEVVPGTRRGEAQGYLSVALQLGIGLGPVLGSAILGPTPLTDSGGRAVADLHPQFTLVCGVAVARALLGLGVALAIRDPYLAGGIRRLPRIEDSLRKEVVAPTLLHFAVVVPRAAAIAYVALLATEQGLFNPGLFFAAYAGATVLVRQFTGRASDRYGRAALFVPGMVISGMAMLLLPFASTVPMFLVSGALYGAGAAAVVPVLYAHAYELVPPSSRGAAMNTLFLGADLGLGLGPWALGLVAAISGIRWTFLGGRAGAATRRALLRGTAVLEKRRAEGWGGVKRRTRSTRHGFLGCGPQNCPCRLRGTTNHE